MCPVAQCGRGGLSRNLNVMWSDDILYEYIRQVQEIQRRGAAQERAVLAGRRPWWRTWWRSRPDPVADEGGPVRGRGDADLPDHVLAQ